MSTCRVPDAVRPSNDSQGKSAETTHKIDSDPAAQRAPYDAPSLAEKGRVIARGSAVRGPLLTSEDAGGYIQRTEDSSRHAMRLVLVAPDGTRLDALMSDDDVRNLQGALTSYFARAR